MKKIKEIEDILKWSDTSVKPMIASETIWSAEIKGKNNTSLFFYIREQHKRWVAEIYSESPYEEEKLVIARFCKCMHPTKESCIPELIKLAHEYLYAKIEKTIKEEKKKIKPILDILDIVTDATIK